MKHVKYLQGLDKACVVECRQVKQSFLDILERIRGLRTPASSRLPASPHTHHPPPPAQFSFQALHAATVFPALSALVSFLSSQQNGLLYGSPQNEDPTDSGVSSRVPERQARGTQWASESRKLVLALQSEPGDPRLGGGGSQTTTILRTRTALHGQAATKASARVSQWGVPQDQSSSH